MSLQVSVQKPGVRIAAAFEPPFLYSMDKLLWEEESTYKSAEQEPWACKEKM